MPTDLYIKIPMSCMKQFQKTRYAASTYVPGILRLRDTHELILWALTFIVLKSSLIVFCIEWSGYHLQSTV